ncbi:metallophosphoesterase [Ornithinimicrobium humiphilum]
MAARDVSEAPLVLAHLSDTHLDGSPRTRERVEAVAATLAGFARPVDAVLVSGDLTEPGPHVEAELAFLESALRPVGPVVYVPGNSDDRQTVRRFLGLSPDPDPIHRVHSVANLHLVLVDTCVPGEMGGRVEHDTVAFVEHSLESQAPDARAVLVMHHPPRLLGHGFVDTVRAVGETARLEECVREDARVIATLVGHTHAATFARFGGKPLMVAPGVHSAGQLPNEFTGDLTGVVDPGAPPAFLVHHVTGDDLVSYVRTAY